MQTTHPYRAGFSLLEVVIVVAIIATISAVAVPKFNTYLAVANTTRIASDLRSLDAVIVVYQMQSATALTAGADGIEKLKTAKLLTEIPKPPKGQCYVNGGSESVAIPGESYAVQFIDGSPRAVLGENYTAESYQN